jgi:hypothetical protein
VGTRVDVTIAIFCDFCQFSAKNGVFLKNQRYDQILQKVAVSLSKNDNIVAKFFSENILEIITYPYPSLSGFLFCTAKLLSNYHSFK